MKNIRFSRIRFVGYLLLLWVAGCNGGGGDGAAAPLILEIGEAGVDCDTCQQIGQPPPFIVLGELDTGTDVDCYCFDGKADTTYLIGITGNNRRVTAERPGEEEPKTGTTGLLEYDPPSDGKVCVCISGGTRGGYVLTVIPT